MSVSSLRLALLPRCRPQLPQRCSFFIASRSFHASNIHRDDHKTISEHRKGHRDQTVTIFSGIQPTGIPHLGNYLGALRQWRDLQNGRYTGDVELSPIFCIVDLHALTTVNPQDAPLLRRRSRETLASLLAVGLDPKRSIIYFQSSLQDHAELMWILSCSASMGYLTRMTQWKSKMELPEDAELTTSSPGKQLKLGLFSYPVLQAADILLHQTDVVPVGADQRQHIEFTRELAKAFNNLYGNKQTYGNVFKLPKIHVSPTERIMSLTNPTEKMSKSYPNESSRILLTDSKETIFRKVKKATTDSAEGISYDREARPGISNLVEILSSLLPAGPNGPQKCKDLADSLKSSSKAQFKETVAESIALELGPIRERFLRIMKDDEKSPEYLDSIAAAGRQSAQDRAKPTMDRVRLALGYAH